MPSAIALARADGSYPSFMGRLQKVNLLILDDWGLYPLDQDAARNIFDALDDRNHSGSVIVVSQIPVANWHDVIAVPTIADAILDRIVHNAYRIQMTGESMRKKLGLTEDEN